MSLREPRFSEYGQGGDRAGARRNRRAFRFAVLFFAVLAASLWFSENFLRYELHQAQYLNALTLEPESARVTLKRAVKEAMEQNNPAAVNYLQALAARQAPEDAVESYRQAYALDPATPSLPIRYGTALYHSGSFEGALQLFQEASAQPRRNALPMYLEAAAIPRLPSGAGRLDESLALTARTNNSGLEMRFPAPLWYKTLPQDGLWYAGLRREIVEQCCAILYQYAGRVVNSAREDTALRQAQYWAPWLEQLQIMGERLAFSEDRGSLQAIAGVQIQLQALRTRQEIKQRVSAEDEPATVTQIARLENALETLNAFENVRDARIAEHEALYRRPLWLIVRALALVIAAYVLAYAATKLADAGRAAWAVEHSALARRVLAGWCLLIFLLLHGATFLQLSGGADLQSMDALAGVWRIVLGATIVFGLLYPLLTIPRPETALARHACTGDDEARQVARREYRDAYLSLQRRYFGIAAGLLLCTVSAWGISYRLIAGLYPWQVNLLASGLGEEEMHAVAQALSLLQ